MDGLSHMIKYACQRGEYLPIHMGRDIKVSHDIFIDDILIFGIISRIMWTSLHNIFLRFGSASRLYMNKDKSKFLFRGSRQEDIEYISNLFGVREIPIGGGLKYLGYKIKPSKYHIQDWLWIVDRFHKNISGWEHRHITLGGRAILVQSVLQQLVIY